MSPDLVAQRGFATSFRGFDQGEVKAFLELVAEELRRLRDHTAALERALHAAQEQAAHPQIDENILMTALGEETASILRSAKTAAADIKTKAEENAARVLREAHARADAVRGEAEGVLAQRTEVAQRAAAELCEAAEAIAERTRTEAGEAAGELIEQAKHEAKAVIDAAQANRDHLLGDVTRKRKVAMVQIEQLRAGRDRLLEAYRIVRSTLDEVTTELQRADAEARAAAEAAGNRAVRLDASVETALAVEDVASLPAVPAANGGAPVVATDEEAAGKLPDPSRSEPEPGVDMGAPESPGSVEAGLIADIADIAPSVETVSASTAPQLTPETTAAVASVAVATSGPLNNLAIVEAPSAIEGVRVISPAEVSAAEDAAAGDAPTSPRISHEDEATLQLRDEALGSIEAELARRLKRALQDEQNDLLDRLRSVRGTPTAAEVLPELAAHLERFRQAGRPLLKKAAKAGGEFAGLLLAGSPSRPAGAQPDLDDLAGGLAAAIVDPLRRRLERAFLGADDDPVVLAESLGAAYREWKTQRIEQTAADQVAGAFARGQLAAMPQGTKLRWIVDDVDGPCPDCDDNALAGQVAKGEAWPTGQRHPPAHAGCRCLMVPAAPEG